MRKLENMKHIFFDLDHTLWDFDVNSKKAYAYIFKSHNIIIDLDKFSAIYEPINHQYWALYREDKISQKELKYARLKDTFDKIGYSIEDAVILQLADDYLQALTKFNMLFEGTLDLLDYLKSKYTLHIITNGFDEIQADKLNNSKINTYFKYIFTSESVQVKKPNPKIFFHALETAGAKTYESVMIGDNLIADINGANNIGLNTIFCNFLDTFEPQNTITVNHLSKIKEYL